MEKKYPRGKHPESQKPLVKHNLKNLTTEERRLMAVKAGKASAKKRREQSVLKKEFANLSQEMRKVLGEEIFEANGKAIKVRRAVVRKIISEALKGSIAALKLIGEWSGEVDQTQNININATVSNFQDPDINKLIKIKKMIDE